ncbi:MAG: class I SAM-dependent methyltransferase [Pseudomonas sp.]
MVFEVDRVMRSFGEEPAPVPHAQAVGGRADFEPKGSYVLQELLQYSGAEFIDVAYRALLKRLPDDSSVSYLRAIENGDLSKVEVLGELRWSSEGLDRSVHVDGLLLPYRFRQWCRKRWFGKPLRWLATLARIDVIHPRVEIMENRLAGRDRRLGEEVRSELEQLRTMLQQQAEQNAAAVEMSLRRRDEALARLGSELGRRLDDVEARLAVRVLECEGRYAEVEGADAKIDLSDMYLRLEDEFRGTRDEIKRRCAVYLPWLEAAAEATQCRRVLDLGCGRGELLDVLGEHGFEARGVDLNELFVQENVVAGRHAELCDVVQALRECEPGSLAAITSMHLVEHLPLDVMVQMLDLAFSALMPGGKLILETPNPQNLKVSTYYFYFDPTHRNPLPPPLLKWLVEDRGFVEGTIDPLADGRFTPEFPGPAADEPGAVHLNVLFDWLRVSPDYAVIATRPA